MKWIFQQNWEKIHKGPMRKIYRESSIIDKNVVLWKRIYEHAKLFLGNVNPLHMGEGDKKEEFIR